MQCYWLCSLCCISHSQGYSVTTNLYFLSPSTLAPNPTTLLPSRDHQLVLCTWVSLCFVFSFILSFRIPRISEIIGYLSFSVRLISLSIIPSRSTYVVTNGNISFFLLLSNIFHCIYAWLLLYPFIYWQTLRSLPHLNYCK